MKRTLIQSFMSAVHGWHRVFCEERNIRIHTIVGAVAIVLAFLLRFSPVELALVFSVSGAVITAELMNAALERYSDIVKPRVSGYVEQVKDIAAASVLVLSVTAAAVGVILYIPKIIDGITMFFTGR